MYSSYPHIDLFVAVGHGRSEGVRVDIHDFQHYVDDAIQFVDIIKSEYPDIPVFVMGHSMVGHTSSRCTFDSKYVVFITPFIEHHFDW